MCDYSLMHLPNRLANQGEELVTHRFAGGSMGLASPADLATQCRGVGEQRTIRDSVREFFTLTEKNPVAAVCVPPGAQLGLHDIPERLRRQCEVGQDEEVSFQQLSAMANTYRDAIVFRNGRTVRLQELPAGLRVSVLALSSAEASMPIAESAEGVYARY